MQLTISFSLLLASIAFMLSFQLAQAAPIKRTPGGTVTLPLRPIEQRGDIHPQVLLQQNINRSLRRLARMTGRAEPTHEELQRHLHKRLLSLEDQGVELTKRYNRKGGSVDAAKLTEMIPGAADGKKGKAQGKDAKGKVKGADQASGASLAVGKSAKGGATGAATKAAAKPDVVTAAKAPTGKNSLGLDIEANDVGYLATVQMGTPPRNFLILMDSGSSDLWVGAENCVSDAGGNCGKHNFLGPKSSKTFVDTAAPFTVTYGTGKVSGTIVTDDINVAGLVLKKHTFGVASTESVEFSSDATPFDGLMGLAQSTLSEQKTKTPVESLAADGLIKNAITSYKIPRLADGKNDGEITFGGLDLAKFNAKTLVTLENVSKVGFWEAEMPAVTVDGKDVGLKGRTAILDTGTTLIIAPPQDAAAVHAAITGAKSDGQGGFTIPCGSKASVALTFGGISFAIDTRDLSLGPIDPADPTGDCVSGISAGTVGAATEWLVGDVFLKNAYFSTDVTKNQLSLAKLV